MSHPIQPAGWLRRRAGASRFHRGVWNGRDVTCRWAGDPPDTTSPTITLNGSNPMKVEAGSSFADPGATATDNVDGNVTTQIQVLGSVNAIRVGAYTLSYSVSDRAGNMASATRIVNVVDTTAPTIDAHASVIVTTASAAITVNYALPATHDAADGDGLAACAPASGSTFPVGTTAVSCTAADHAGNAAATTFTVIVSNDVKPPKVKVPNHVTVEATALSTLGQIVTFVASATDKTEGPLAVTCTPASGSVFFMGITNVTCSAIDGSGNSATASFPVTVRDTKPPVLMLPANIVVEATAPFGEEVSFALAMASDIADGAVRTTCGQISVLLPDWARPEWTGRPTVRGTPGSST
jgi:hypothetical protein